MQTIADRSVLLATSVQDWNLVGWPVWVSLVVGIIGVLMTTGGKFPPKAVQLRLHVLMPVMMLTFCLLSRAKSWLGFFYKGYYAQLDVAFVISFAFGIAFTVDAIRTHHWFTRACGTCYVLAYAWLSVEATRYALNW